MTEHLPECPLMEPCGADTPKHGFCSRQQTWCIHCERGCICERIQGAEARALREAQLRVAAIRDPWPNTAPGTIKRSQAIAAIKGESAIKGDQP